MDELEKFLKENYDHECDIPLRTENDPRDLRKIYINTKPINNSIKHLGFQEEILVRIVLKENQHIAQLYTKKQE